MSAQDLHATTFGAASPEEEHAYYCGFHCGKVCNCCAEAASYHIEQEITANYSATDYVLFTGAAGAIVYLLFTYLAAEFGIGISL